MKNLQKYVDMIIIVDSYIYDFYIIIVFMKKIIAKILSLSAIFLAFVSCSFAIQYESKWSDNPMDTLTNMVDDANKWWYKIQDTALDEINDLEWINKKYKITNTLEYLRKNIDPYMQWAIYVWLVLATVVLIYMWFLLVTWWIHKSWDFSKLKTRFGYVVVWVLLLTWFYVILKVAVALINTIFAN